VTGEEAPVEAATMVNPADSEAPPPGAGLTTVIVALSTDAMSLAGIEAVSVVAFINVVLRLELFHRTVELLMKFVPVTLNVNAEPPAVAELGEMDTSVGAGLEATVIVKG
jgi:hypothetical protein